MSKWLNIDNEYTNWIADISKRFIANQVKAVV